MAVEDMRLADRPQETSVSTAAAADAATTSDSAVILPTPSSTTASALGPEKVGTMHYFKSQKMCKQSNKTKIATSLEPLGWGFI